MESNVVEYLNVGIGKDEFKLMRVDPPVCRERQPTEVYQ